MRSAIKALLAFSAAASIAGAAHAADGADLALSKEEAIIANAAAARAEAQQQPTLSGGRYSSLLIGGPSPTLFRAINVNDWRTDLSRFGESRPEGDFSDAPAKSTYAAPANALGGVLGGFQFGVSYAPTLRSCGDHLCASDSGIVLAPDGTFLTETSQWDEAVEGALYYEKGLKLGSDRLLVGVGASVVNASQDARSLSALYGDFESYSLGLNIGFRGITLGGSVKSTNAGLASLDEDGYLAFDAGVTFRTGEDKGDLGFMLSYAEAGPSAMGPNPADPILFRDTRTAQAGVTYFIGRGVTIGAAAQYVESTKPAAAGGPEEAATVVIESSIRF